MGRAEEFKEAWVGHINDLYRLGFTLEKEDYEIVKSHVEGLKALVEKAYLIELKGEKIKLSEEFITISLEEKVY